MSFRPLTAGPLLSLTVGFRALNSHCYSKFLHHRLHYHLIQSVCKSEQNVKHDKSFWSEDEGVTDGWKPGWVSGDIDHCFQFWEVMVSTSCCIGDPSAGELSPFFLFRQVRMLNRRRGVPPLFWNSSDKISKIIPSWKDFNWLGSRPPVSRGSIGWMMPDTPGRRNAAKPTHLLSGKAA